MISLPSKSKKTRGREILEFADGLMDLSSEIGFKVSSRGWCYILEGRNLITKAQFDIAEKIINECRKKGLLSVDFIAEEEGRQFAGVEIPDDVSPVLFMRRYLNAALQAEDYYIPNWWTGEKYYIQMLVEKIDLKTLFQPVCSKFKIPIATSKGWSSILQRAIYGRRFKKAEEEGLKCVLLYCGDHDPDGLLIDEFCKKNLEDIENIEWEDGVRGYDPRKLIIDRFGLNFDFIDKQNLTWIENLITGSGKDLSDPAHRNHYLPYVQEYLKEYGPRKCEANALVVKPEEGQDLCRKAIEKYLGKDGPDRFEKKIEDVQEILDEFREESGLKESLKKAIKIIEEEDEK